jgi:hypothetical protein
MRRFCGSQPAVDFDWRGRLILRNPVEGCTLRQSAVDTNRRHFAAFRQLHGHGNGKDSAWAFTSRNRDASSIPPALLAHGEAVDGLTVGLPFGHVLVHEGDEAGFVGGLQEVGQFVDDEVLEARGGF